MIRNCQISPSRLLPILESINFNLALDLLLEETSECSQIASYYMRSPEVSDTATDKVNRPNFNSGEDILLNLNDEESEWVDNVISRQTVVYSCGMIGRRGEILEHNHHPEELELCDRLSKEVAEIMRGTKAAGDEGEHPFLPFYIAINEGESIPNKITGAVIRSAFRGTIHPRAAVTVEPLDESGEWWKNVLADEETSSNLDGWRNAMQWFKVNGAVDKPVFVAIEDSSSDYLGCGSVFPRLVLGLTKRGSLVGLCSQVVHT